jgi:hypothetical protein
VLARGGTESLARRDGSAALRRGTSCPGTGQEPVGPFALGDDEYVQEILEGASFRVLAVTAHETSVRAPADAVADHSLLPLMGIATEHEGPAREALDAHLERFAVGDGAYEYPLAFRVYEAVNDGT